MGYFFKALRVMAIFTDWVSKAMVDGKITAREAADLAQRLGDALGIPTEIELPK